ncbi:sushi domain-containing protein 2-like [Mya arenaria]|uniref:sushi domain-containing protein 2-like n=1 Tax=Mya arenaria TaxID=6604 RepID=UPI0022E7CAA6|nr:sushi domain-containing protein 2-like [Mya arenaria]
MALLTGYFIAGFFIINVAITTIQGASPLYNFNSATVNEINPGEVGKHIVTTTTPIIYEGRSFSSAIITKNGLVAFTEDVRQVNYATQDWSDSNVSPYIDIPFIAPYYHNGQSVQTLPDYTGHIRYQEFQYGTQNQTLRALGRYCISQVVGTSEFVPTWGMIVTWVNVTSTVIINGNKPKCEGTFLQPCPMNTFQLVLLTDGTESYSILNYDKMAMKPSKYSQAGFNGGSGMGWMDVLSRSVGLTHLNHNQSSDTMGRYVFRISDGNVVRAGCSTENTYSGLSIYPQFGGMFGGKMIDVSGPCFQANQRYRCYFGEIVDDIYSDATYVSQTKVRCPIPKLYQRGRITLTLQTSSRSYNTTITIVFPGRIPSDEHIATSASKTDMAWLDTSPSSLTLTWHPEMLSNNSYDKVDVNLIGYKEEGGKGMYIFLTTLGTDIQASQGTYTINPQDHQCMGSSCLYEIGLLEVKLKDNAVPMMYQSLSSKVLPLGWYVQNSMKQKHGNSWPTEMCVNWYNQDRKDMSWLDNLPYCPCSLSQALSDFGRFQPDVGCNLNSRSPKNCFYHGAAVHCVRAVQPVNGAGNQCCYSSAGLLVYAADTFKGSTPDRGHDWGAAPYRSQGYVPSLSHWLDDIITLHYCCVWTEYKSCDYYMDQRPTKDCAGYNPPVPVSAYGQGHISTFSGLKHRIRGPGDYVLMQAGNTIIQGRFERNPYPTENGQKINTTVTLTSVAVQDVGTSDRVEIQLCGPEYNRSQKRLNVHVNGVNAWFDNGPMFWQDFKGLAVVNSDHTRNLQSNYTVLLTNGIGFQVAEASNTLQLLISVPHTFASVSGLFGGLNASMFMPNGTVTDVRKMSPQEIHTFQVAWSVNDERSSLFQNFLPANNSLLGPVVLSPTPLPNIGSENICQQDKECDFDYKMTGSRAIAQSTRDAVARFDALSQNLQPIRSCGLLDVPRSKKSNYGYTVGTTTTITGCRVGELQGTSTYTCTATSNTTQQWKPAVEAVCSISVEDADIGLIVGVVAAVVVVVIVAIVVVVVTIKKRRSQKNKKSSEEEHEPDEIEPMNEFD